MVDDIRSLDATSTDAEACGVCGERLVRGGRCSNTVCGLQDRFFSRIHTVSEHSEEMWNTVYRYKYGDERFRAEALGRSVVGFLEAHRGEMQRYELITPGAIHVAPAARRHWDYLQLIVAAAEAAGPC